MKYMGSKNRIAKHLKPFLEKNLNGENWYVEPFVGGANMIDKIDYDKRMGCDNNKYLIEMYNYLKTNTIEFPHDKSHYDEVRNQYNKKLQTPYPDYYIGYVGFMASANGRFFEGGYSGISKTKEGKERNYIQESIRGLNKQLPLLKDIKFYYKDYKDIKKLPPKCVIYCDIPYKDSKQYSTSKGFNHTEFWNWCREKVKENHFVYISEYNAPSDFVCLWEQEVKSSLSANGKSGGNKKSIEKLFVHESQLEQCKLN